MRTSTPTAGRRNRVLLALAAAWIAIAIAIGGASMERSQGADTATDPNAAGNAAQR